jgi:hypothetical protein
MLEIQSRPDGGWGGVDEPSQVGGEGRFQGWDELVELWHTIMAHLEASEVVAVADAVS